MNIYIIFYFNKTVSSSRLMCVISAIVCFIKFYEQAQFWDWVFYKLLGVFVFFIFSKTCSTDFAVVKLIRAKAQMRNDMS